MYGFCIFSAKIISVYATFNDQSFNDMLTNDILSFEQLGPGIVCSLSSLVAACVVVLFVFRSFRCRRGSFLALLSPCWDRESWLL